MRKVWKKYRINMRAALSAACFALGLGSAAPGLAMECFPWGLRQHNGYYAYDGDTIYIRMPGLPEAIASMSVRVAGVDAPEMRAGCVEEKQLAIQARDRVRDLLQTAVRSNTAVLFCDPRWGRYGGRVVARVAIGDHWLHDLLLAEGLARPYEGGKRAPWCD